jgi:hypothetical protein
MTARPRQITLTEWVGGARGGADARRTGVLRTSGMSC